MGITDLLKKNKVWIILALLVTLIHIVYASIINRGAYLDGAMIQLILLNKFSAGQYAMYTDPGHTRFFINFIEQLPMAIGYFVFLIKSKFWLSFLFSLPLFLFPPLLLWWNYNLSKRTQRYDLFVLSVFSYSAILLPYTIFSIVEITVAALMQFILLNYLVGDINYTKKDLFLIAFLVIALFGSQEFVLFVGFTLFLASIYYALKEKNTFNKKVKYAIGAGGLFSSLYVAFFIITHSQTQSESGRFFKEATDFFPQLLSLNSILSITAFIIITLLLFKKDYLKQNFQIFIGLIFLGLIGYMLSHLNIYVSPMWEGHLRSIPCWGIPLFFMTIVVLDITNRKPSNVFYTNLLTVALICGIAQTAWQINNTFWFNKNIEYMKQELKKSPDPLYIPSEHKEISSFNNEELRRYLWNFSYAATSILFAPEREVKTLLLQPVTRKDEEGGNLSFPEWLYTEKDHIIIPTTTLDIENEFWDATNVAKALEEYNKKHNNYQKQNAGNY